MWAMSYQGLAPTTTNGAAPSSLAVLEVELVAFPTGGFMHAATQPAFPNYSWLAFRITCQAKPVLFSNHIQSRCHMVGLAAHGSQFVRWISRGREKRWQMNTGAVNFYPRDDEQHTFLLSQEPSFDMPVFLIPDAHLRACLDTDHCGSPAEMRQHTFHDDALLQSCLRRLASPRPPSADDPAMGSEETARQLVLRLVELCTGAKPPWHADTSVFTRRTMLDLVDFIDAHLQAAPSLSHMASLVRLSPSHFARKFRQSTGLSLNRFVNLRRVHKALDMLKTNRESLDSAALDLGFCSQSHLTREFSRLTGMTPAKYRKQFRRTVG